MKPLDNLDCIAFLSAGLAHIFLELYEKNDISGIFKDVLWRQQAQARSEGWYSFILFPVL